MRSITIKHQVSHLPITSSPSNADVKQQPQGSARKARIFPCAVGEVVAVAAQPTDALLGETLSDSSNNLGQPIWLNDCAMEAVIWLSQL